MKTNDPVHLDRHGRALSVLLEAVRVGTAPAAIVLSETDGILALGAVVARELYGATPPIVALSPVDHDRLSEDDRIDLRIDGRLLVERTEG